MKIFLETLTQEIFDSAVALVNHHNLQKGAIFEESEIYFENISIYELYMDYGEGDDCKTPMPHHWYNKLILDQYKIDYKI